VRIAVIVPAFNVAPFLAESIQSVVDQTHADWSLVVVDDGSADTTGAIAASFHDKRISLIRQENAGVSAARNRGIGHFGVLSHDALLFLDGDDWLAPNALALLAETLEDAPWAVAACGRYARVAANGDLRLAAAPVGGCLLEPLLTRNLFANGGHLLIRQEAVAAAGAFRSDLRYGEDWEYWVRLALQGEFVAVRSRSALLFVRERAGSAYLSQATDPSAYAPAIETIHANPAIAFRLGGYQAAYLRRRADAEIAWTVGRELIRHGHQRDGQLWLRRSVHSAPSLKRVALLGLSRLRFGPFRRYATAAG
jgi:glycosyltransferase involved in cell wall biosynthesis